MLAYFGRLKFSRLLIRKTHRRIAKLKDAQINKTMIIILDTELISVNTSFIT